MQKLHFLESFDKMMTHKTQPYESFFFSKFHNNIMKCNAIWGFRHKELWLQIICFGQKSFIKTSAELQQKDTGDSIANLM